MTYKGLLIEYFKRNKKLDEISDRHWARYMASDVPTFLKIQNDVQAAHDDNSELFNYQLERAYETV